MRFIFALIVLIIAAEADNVPRKLQAKWTRHTNKYRLSFSDGASEQKSYHTYERRVADIAAWNNDASKTFKLAENQFSHLDMDYIKKHVLMQARAAKANSRNSARTAAVAQSATNVVETKAASMNWTSMFGPIKDQGYCGSCYAFAAVGAIEGAYAIQYGQKVNLSEEQIIDCTYELREVCSGSYYTTCNFEFASPNIGCYGGDSLYSLEYALQNGLYSSSDYPYASYYDFDAAPGDTCHNVTSPTSPRVKISGYNVTYPHTEDSILAQLQYGPVTAYLRYRFQKISASYWSFLSYSDGIYFNPQCSQETDHAVVIVGYGTDASGSDYWIIRNSWGTSWGMNGYGLMARNQDGMCGIATENYYATFSQV